MEFHSTRSIFGGLKKVIKALQEGIIAYILFFGEDDKNGVLIHFVHIRWEVRLKIIQKPRLGSLHLVIGGRSICTVLLIL